MDDRYVVIGVGNPLRGDDGVGLRVAAELVGRLDTGVELTTSDGDPGELMDMWRDAACAVVVDAMLSGRDAGTVEVFDVTNASLPACLTLESTHRAGTASAVELARALDRLPACLFIVGVEGTVFDLGEELSDDVAASVDDAVTAIEKILAHA